jgi:DNA invertase Pin-like site-specific DNA recombinase
LQLRRLIEQFAAGDVLLVTRIDRLVRWASDRLNTSPRLPGARPVS